MVSDLCDGAAVEQIAKKTVAVAGHGDEIALFTGGNLQDFSGRISHREQRIDGEFLGTQLAGNFFQIGSVFFDFIGFGKLQLVKAACGKTISDMKQQDFRTEACREFRDVRQKSFIRRAILKGDEDFFIHVCFSVARR